MKRRRNPARHLARTPFPDFTSFNPGYKLALPGTIALQRREKVSMAYDEETAARVRKVLSGRRDVVEKKMMGGLSFMADGAMFCSELTRESGANFAWEYCCQRRNV